MFFEKIACKKEECYVVSLCVCVIYVLRRNDSLKKRKIMDDHSTWAMSAYSNDLCDFYVILKKKYLAKDFCLKKWLAMQKLCRWRKFRRKKNWWTDWKSCDFNFFPGYILCPYPEGCILMTKWYNKVMLHSTFWEKEKDAQKRLSLKKGNK